MYNKFIVHNKFISYYNNYFYNHLKNNFVLIESTLKNKCDKIYKLNLDLYY